jgi:hypothetical protein
MSRTLRWNGQVPVRAVDRILQVASLAGHPLDLTNTADNQVAVRATTLVEEGGTPVTALLCARREVLLTQGLRPREAHLLADALLISVDADVGDRLVVERCEGRYGSIEFLAPEPRVDRLIRTMLADGPCSLAGIRRVARAIGISEGDLAEAATRVGAIEAHGSIRLSVDQPGTRRRSVVMGWVRGPRQ